MITSGLLLCFIVLFMAALQASTSAAPLTLHPHNPHYFLFRGRPFVIIGSGEHYGAVLNLDFDYQKYLDTLHKEGLNHTRTFVGAYCEQDGAFKITRNTLAPAPGRFICPWARSNQPGYANGGNKFDLSRWDEAYFARLKDFVAQASARDIIVEINLFCPFYEEAQWALSPMNSRNNINNVGNVSKDAVYTLDAHGGLLPFQEAMTRKIVTELNSSENIYYEVMNEPYARNVSREWEHHIVDVIVETEKTLPQKHLISLNIANHKAKIENPPPAVDIFNFHYAFPPETVAMNYGLQRVIGDNETGFAGQSDRRYRMEAWAFVLAGGALFSHLDYSFAVGYEDGSFVYPPTQPGGGSATLRRQLRSLKDFIHSLDFVRMRPDASAIQKLPDGVFAQALVEPGKQYAVYFYQQEAPAEKQAISVSINLPAGTYQGRWLHCATGDIVQFQLKHNGGEIALASPNFEEDIALCLIHAQ